MSIITNPSVLADRIEGHSDYTTKVLTAFNGWIYEGDARKNYLEKDSKLVNVNDFMKKRVAGAAGNIEAAAKIDPYTDKMKGYLEDSKRISGAASSGNNIIETPYEVVRQIRTLTEIVGPMYRMANYNAQEIVNVRNVDSLNFVGWTKNALTEGTPEIGDDVTPQPVRQAFTAFDKAIFADAFRYEFSQREKKDSAINIEREIIADVAGAMARMKDNKITSVLNAAASLGDITPDWDSVTGNFYDADAAKDIETDDNALSSLGGATHIILPRDVIRLYKRNIQSAIAGTPPASTEPDGARIFPLPLNEHITAVVNNQITANTFILVAKPAWMDMYQGPVVNVAYKNNMNAGQMEGAILFDFNGVVEKLTTARRKRNGLT
jgi:hypothetical protein